MNELARSIRSETDARIYVNEIGKMFADYLPARWTRDAVLDRVAHAEYRALKDSSHLIAEQHIAYVWNDYVREIGAPEEALVTAAEIHSMREAMRTSSQMMWSQGSQTIWTVPEIYAEMPDGTIAQGCRAIETLRILYTMENLFDNVLGARQRLREQHSAASLPRSFGDTQASYSAGIRSSVDLTRASVTRYVHEHGINNYNAIIDQMVNALFPLR